jgi:hypothetical protein
MKMKMTEQNPKEISSLFQKDYTNAMDLRGNPIGSICMCGSELFTAIVGFDEGEISFYFLDGECVDCGSLVTLPTPIDDIGMDCM